MAEEEEGENVILESLGHNFCFGCFLENGYCNM